ncbi:MAG TPA: CotH kinase family protein [Microthrixaceae bacterium]|nr:CotH kinase family protein [Microthrixaceae bacterium]
MGGTRLKNRVQSSGRRGAAVVVLMVAGLVAAACAPITPYIGWGGLLDVRLGDGTMEASWPPPPDATPTSSYELVRWPTGNFGALTSTFTDQTSVVLDGVTEGLTDRTWYSFRVRALNEGEPGRWSDEVLEFYAEPDLPVLRIETVGDAPILDKEHYVPGTFALDSQGVDPAASGNVEIRGRGNSTWSLPKRPYRIKLGSSTSLLGMPANRHWVLLANSLDPGQLRNSTAFELSERTDLAWTPRYRDVELILNGSYEGVYQLVEHIRIDANRVNIDKLSASNTTEPAVTGGYLLEVDAWLGLSGDPGFSTPTGLSIRFDDPEAPVPPAQFTYVQNYVSAFENVLFSPTFTDPVTGYGAYIDVDSFIDWYLVNEITNNKDAFVSSTWLYKPRGEKLAMGPVWDFDRSMGIDGTHKYDEFWVRQPDRLWFDRLFQDPAFIQRVRDRWSQFEPSFREVPDEILGAHPSGSPIADALLADSLRWGTAGTAESTPAFLADWLTHRLNWLDGVDQYGDGIPG